ncbi:MAG: hypothetical protein P4L26_16450 [Terracidiphilus sp.]|nr:hypothetical protein [Terracidiphilus sp.]
MAMAAVLPLALGAQDSAKPAKAASTATWQDSPSKWDVFAGYSYLAPHGTVVTTGGGFTTVLQAIDYGSILSVARYFNKYVGVQLEADEHIVNQTATGGGSTYANDDFSGGGGGLIFRHPSADVTPFAHALVGLEYGGVYHSPDAFGPVLTLGGGLDYETPFFDHHLAIRIFQADYQYTHENLGAGGRVNANMARLSAGFVYHIGSILPPPPATLACSASPTSIFPGDPVTVTATAGALDPKLNAVYSWSGTGASGTGTTVTIATGSLAAGAYTVKATVKEGKPGKEGLKPGQAADCSASFTVKAFEPPTISCTANPSTIKPGESSTVTSMGMSPQNRPLTYSYSASAGSVSGSGTTATFSSAGAPTGAVGITCNVSDDKGQTATASTSVTITAPYVPPAPHTQALCSLNFSTDAKRPTRVDNEAKACLDQVALDLQRQSDAKAVVVGESDAKEKAATTKAEKLAAKRKHAKPVIRDDAQRAVNTKEYLVTEKGIDASRISVATGSTDGQTVEDYLVPAGATFSSDISGTTPVDETTVKPEVRKPLGERPHAHKKAAAAKK